MQAVSAVILAFPRRVPSAAADELELLPEHRLTSEPAAPRGPVLWSRLPGRWPPGRPTCCWRRPSSCRRAAVPSAMRWGWQSRSWSSPPQPGRHHNLAVISSAGIVSPARASSHPPVLLMLGALAGGLALSPAATWCCCSACSSWRALARSLPSRPGRRRGSRPPAAGGGRGCRARARAGAGDAAGSAAAQPFPASRLLAMAPGRSPKPGSRLRPPDAARGDGGAHSAALTADPWLQRARGSRRCSASRR